MQVVRVFDVVDIFAFIVFFSLLFIVCSVVGSRITHALDFRKQTYAHSENVNYYSFSLKMFLLLFRSNL